MATFDQLLAQRDTILAMAASHGAEAVRVFGSVARGDDRGDSDIDFLIHMQPERSLMDLIGFKLDLESLLHRPADVVTEGGLHPLIRDRVLRDARPL
ncbi:MAG: nucleotidyltransferase family protein [Betaproteobacteria bacterium]|nr:nucleotidyltransferase family protein [Betaproteobacteria bacterium]MBK8916905.1 nucleotidyltransferase family protein [Betaproteobacteria bacterium]